MSTILRTLFSRIENTNPSHLLLAAYKSWLIIASERLLFGCHFRVAVAEVHHEDDVLVEGPTSLGEPCIFCWAQEELPLKVAVYFRAIFVVIPNSCYKVFNTGWDLGRVDIGCW